MATEINDQTKGEFGVVATATKEGFLQLVDTSGGNIKIVMTAISSFVTTMQDADNIATTVAKTTVHYGQITLHSTDGNVIKLTDGSTSNAGLAKLGLNGQSAMEEPGSGGVNVSSLSGATSALANIDEE